MTIETIIKKSIEGKYPWKKWKVSGWIYLAKTPFIERVLLDKEFWQGLGKALGWEHKSAYCKVDNHTSCFHRKNKSCKCYCHYWIDLIYHLAKDKDAESFFKELK